MIPLSVLLKQVGEVALHLLNRKKLLHLRGKAFAEWSFILLCSVIFLYIFHVLSTGLVSYYMFLVAKASCFSLIPILAVRSIQYYYNVVGLNSKKDNFQFSISNSNFYILKLGAYDNSTSQILKFRLDLAKFWNLIKSIWNRIFILYFLTLETNYTNMKHTQPYPKWLNFLSNSNIILNFRVQRNENWNIKIGF